MAHWTKKSDKAFIHRITFDFVAQLEKRIETLQLKQSDLAKTLGVTEGSVSQVLNSERDNLTLKTMVAYATALGMKVAIVAYDDQDPNNEYGPVGSEIFATTWEKVGRPRDVWSLNECVKTVASNRSALPNIGGYVSLTWTGTGSYYISTFSCSNEPSGSVTSANTDQRRGMAHA
jgi:predicted XRE-type DNA-binding protein